MKPSSTSSSACRRIAITPGEPAGIGPDLVITLAQQPHDTPLVAIAGLAKIITFHSATFGEYLVGAGAMLLGITQNLMVWQFSSRWTMAAAFALLVTVLLLKPEGLFGEADGARA